MENKAPDKSWLHGKYEDGYEINLDIPYIAFGDEFYSQGDEALEIIDDIYDLWVNHDVEVKAAMEYWEFMYL